MSIRSSCPDYGSSVTVSGTRSSRASPSASDAEVIRSRTGCTRFPSNGSGYKPKPYRVPYELLGLATGCIPLGVVAGVSEAGTRIRSRCRRVNRRRNWGRYRCCRSRVQGHRHGAATAECRVLGLRGPGRRVGSAAHRLCTDRTAVLFGVALRRIPPGSVAVAALCRQHAVIAGNKSRLRSGPGCRRRDRGLPVLGDVVGDITEVAGVRRADEHELR